jgi:hypothetical protein
MAATGRASGSSCDEHGLGSPSMRRPTRSLEPDDVEPRAREWKRGDATDRAEPDDDYVGLLKVAGTSVPVAKKT